MMKSYKYLIGSLLGLFLSVPNANGQNNLVEVDSLNNLYQNLPEVMIKGERPIAKIEKGKLTYQMPLLLKQLPADNAFDALTKIPGVFVQSDNISFANKPVTLIIDGRISSMSYEEVVERLKTMPAERLEKAEMMLSAPARYHVRGAVINVVTKDYKGAHHLSGQLQGLYNQSKYSKGQAKGNLLFTDKKLTIDANYSFTRGKSYSEVEHKAKHPLNGTAVDYFDFTDNQTWGNSHQYRVGADYQFDKDHQLSVAYNGSYSDYNSNNKTTGNSLSSNHSEGHQTLHNIDVNYSLPFGLSMSASYTGYKAPKEQSLDGTIEQEVKKYASGSNQQIDKFMFTADQSHSLKNDWTVMYGAKAQFSKNNSYQNTHNATGETLPEATSEVEINERIANAYGGFSKQFSKGISLDASATIENYHTPKWNEWRIYPSLNFMWEVNDRHSLNLTFDSNAQYPSYWSTMSAVSYSSTYSEIWGSPELKATSDYNLSLMWQINRKYTIMAFAEWQPNFSVQLPYQPSDRMAVIMKEVNFNHRNSFGLQASASFRLGSWLNGNAFVSALYNNDKCDEFFDLAFNRNKLVVVSGGTASAKISKRLNFILNPFFQSDAIQGVYDINSIFRLNASLRWTSGNNRWNVILGGNNLTNNYFKTQSMYGNQNFVMKVNQNWINASLTCVYKFGNFKEKKLKAVDTSRMGH